VSEFFWHRVVLDEGMLNRLLLLLLVSDNSECYVTGPNGEIWHYILHCL